MKVYLSPLAEQKLTKLTEYLLEAWGHKVKNNFLGELGGKIDQR
ncbi:MAG: type II toxin-antitoxin system RelE/ParE family toxin [Leeuwenhoekiella sp.]